RVKLKAKRTFLKKGTCSRTFFYILDREFGHPLDEEEKAIDPLAGGILQQGYQCGMLWGASMALGAEAFRRKEDQTQVTALTILATQHVMKSFEGRTSSIECEDITQCDFTNKKSFLKYMLSGKFVGCFILAGKWAPEALEAAKEGLKLDQADLPQQSLSCASEVVRKMGASEEEASLVAGFAGGLGLSGSGCGALAAAVWMNALIHNRKQTGKSANYDPSTDLTLNAFYEETDYEMQCDKICGQRFETIEEHTEFLKNGGCKKLIEVLADTVTLFRTDN
ncbi:MAG: C-GCAxxG-C-C family (seleno)protein, partial [Bacteroidota bacterium]|nr:C-GCAxxG-C-C family (seleno)protein [Bacteroidota bacterium]